AAVLPGARPGLVPDDHHRGVARGGGDLREDQLGAALAVAAVDPGAGHLFEGRGVLEVVGDHVFAGGGAHAVHLEEPDLVRAAPPEGGAEREQAGHGAGAGGEGAGGRAAGDQVGLQERAGWRSEGGAGWSLRGRVRGPPAPRAGGPGR
ncbi:MAG: hypothetical protein ACK56I_31155, partial [bacterium]